MKIGIIDYGGGNTRSVVNAVSFLGKPYIFSDQEKELLECSHFILPGVGSFGKVMELLEKRHLTGFLERYILKEGRYYLGVCVGMQILMEEGEEFGMHRGLGWMRGKCLKLDTQGLFLPHIGWNSIRVGTDFLHLFNDIPDGSSFYFIHSYAACLEENVPVATCCYGTEFSAAVMKDNIFGVQFHPEKSQRTGLQLLKNFCEL